MINKEAIVLTACLKIIDSAVVTARTQDDGIKFLDNLVRELTKRLEFLKHERDSILERKKK